MVAYTKPQHRTKEESERLRGERDKIKFIALLRKRLNINRQPQQFVKYGSSAFGSHKPMISRAGNKKIT